MTGSFLRGQLQTCIYSLSLQGFMALEKFHHSLVNCPILKVVGLILDFLIWDSQWCLISSQLGSSRLPYMHHINTAFMKIVWKTLLIVNKLLIISVIWDDQTWSLLSMQWCVDEISTRVEKLSWFMPLHRHTGVTLFFFKLNRHLWQIYTDFKWLMITYVIIRINRE